MMNTTPEQKKGIVGTVIVHVLLLLALFFFALRTPLPLPGEEGMEIRMGNSDEGTFADNIAQTATTPPPQPAQPENLEPVVTQSQEETVAIPAQPKPQQHRPTEERPIETPKPEPKPTVDPRALYSGSTTSSSGGGTGSSGDFGRPDGTSQTGGLTGGGQGNGQGSGTGQGQGSDYFLNGREVKSLKRPTYNSGEQGRVVVEIFVDKNGNVIKARAGAKVPDTHLGTTTSDPTLWKQAEEAALQSKFSKDDKATEQQKGYIVYNFVKQGE